MIWWLLHYWHTSSLFEEIPRDSVYLHIIFPRWAGSINWCDVNWAYGRASLETDRGLVPVLYRASYSCKQLVFTKFSFMKTSEHDLGSNSSNLQHNIRLRAESVFVSGTFDVNVCGYLLVWPPRWNCTVLKNTQLSKVIYSVPYAKAWHSNKNVTPHILKYIVHFTRHDENESYFQKTRTPKSSDVLFMVLIVFRVATYANLMTIAK